jgi:hypothetical protein
MSPTTESADHSAAGLVVADARMGCVEDTSHDSSNQVVPETSDEGHAVN